MRLDQLTIEIRPRRPWEAVDLGMRMAQRWWRKLSLIFLCFSLPIWLLLELIPLEYWYYRLLIFWLLLPLFERPLLFFLSKAVFNELPTMKQVFRETPQLMLRQFILSLSWRRLSPSRSMDAPVVILENLKGSQRSSRLSTLHREDASPAAWLSVICFVFVYAIAMGLLIVTLQFASHFFDTPWWQVIEEDGWGPFFSRWTGLLLYHFLYLGFALVTPFYVATGFALYLNRRIKLEAWDVEIAFRRMVQKRSKTNEGFTSSIVAALLCIGFTLSSVTAPVPICAEETVAESISPFTETKNEIESILKGEHFNRIEVEKTWRLPFEIEQDEEESDADFREKLAKFLEQLMSGIANWGEIMLWVAVFCLVFYLIFRYRHWFAELAPDAGNAKTARPETLFGLDVAEQSLPDDVAAAALTLWRAGKHREALALLYRACLVQLIDRGLELEDGDTELECLQVTQKNASALQLQEHTLVYFSALTRHWRRLAYGHITPVETEGMHLCSEWTQAWGMLNSEGMPREN